MKSKLAEEIKLIARLSLMIPTAVMLTTPALWWAVEPIMVFAAYLLGIIGTAVLLGTISVYDEVQKLKAYSPQEENDNGR